MKRKLIILFILLLLTGCKAKYNLQINFGGNVIESGKIYFDSSLLGKGEYPSNSNDFLKKMGTDYRFSWIKKKLPFKENSYFGYNFYQRYHNGISYANQSPAIKVLFNKLSVTEDNHHVKWSTEGTNKISDYHHLNNDVSTNVEVIEISISLPFKVINNNANVINKDTNTYTWRFYPNIENKNIVLEYLDNELFTYNPAYLFNYVSIYVYIMLFLLIIVLIVAVALKSKADGRNRL